MNPPSTSDKPVSPGTGLQVTEGCFGLALMGLLLLCYWIYSPGISGPLLLDDFWNLRPLGEDGGIDNLEKLRNFVFSNTSGPSGRPVSMASFLLDAQDWPPLVANFKYTNILIHLLTGTLVFWFALLLCGLLGLVRSHSLQVALVVTALWLLHPFNNSTVLYVVQRMTQLMTLFSLAALVCYLAARNLLHSKPVTAAVLLALCLFPFGLLAVLSKENGALLLFLIIIMELLFFKERQVTRLFKLWFRVGVLLPAAAIVAYLVYSAPENLALYDIRQFSLGERLLTETRVLTSYLWEIFVPNAIGNGLFHDDLVVSSSLFNPLTTFFSSLFIVGLLGSAVALRKQYALYSFAVFWFFLLHVLESSYLPLELYFEHRNYLPMIGPLFALVFSLHAYLVTTHYTGIKQALGATAVVVVLLCSWSSWVTARQWGDTLLLHSQWAEEKPRSIRAQTTYAEYLNEVQLHDVAMERLQLAHSFYPDEITIRLFMWNQACEYGLDRPFALGELIADPNLEYYRDDINHYLGNFIENLIARRCEFPDRETLIALFERIGELPLPPPRKASYYVYFSDLFVYFGLLDPALINLTRAFELNRVPQIPIRQAIISASAGLFDNALVFLERAKQADAENNPLIPSAMNEILRLESDFLARLDSD